MPITSPAQHPTSGPSALGGKKQTVHATYLKRPVRCSSIGQGAFCPIAYISFTYDAVETLKGGAGAPLMAERGGNLRQQKQMRWFRSKSDQARSDEQLDAPRIVYPKLAQNAVLSLSKMGNIYLGRVCLRSFSPKELDLVRLTGMLSMPTVEDGEKLIVQGNGDNHSPFSLVGTVSSASRLHIRLTNLALMTAANMRENPRFLVNRKVEVYHPEQANYQKKPEPCELVDISMTGARIRSDMVYAQDQVIKLRVELYEHAGKISFLCQVIQPVYNESGLHEYGLLFEELPPAKKQYLREDLNWLAEH